MDWNNLYRPKSLTKVLGQEHIIPKLQEIVRRIHAGGDGSMPNLLYSGMQGTGKTSAAEAMLQDMFGESWRENLLPLDASDDRTLKSIREKVKVFAKRQVTATYEINGEERLHPFKVIIMEEVDHLHHDAQPALRRIMEMYSKNTRFILTCNYPHKIISPVRDRCSTFKFMPLKPEHLRVIAENLIDEEEIDVKPKTLSYICNQCNGSVRELQEILYTCSLNDDRFISQHDAQMNLGGKIRRFSKIVFDLLGSAINDYSKFQDIDLEIESWHKEKGVQAEEMLIACYNYIDDNDDMPPRVKGNIFSKLGTALERINMVENQLIHVKLFFRSLVV